MTLFCPANKPIQRSRVVRQLPDRPTEAADNIRAPIGPWRRGERVVVSALAHGSIAVQAMVVDARVLGSAPERRGAIR